MEIIFTNTSPFLHIKSPEPSSKSIPEWYKNTESYISGKKKPDGNGKTTATIKRCMPVFDAIISGYIIYSSTDVYVSIKDGQHWFEWPSINIIDFHPIEQAHLYPNKNEYSAYPKWINPWSVKTPSGYSILITQPLHRESPFTILDGIVDTDKYFSPVNFPFVMNDSKFEGLIPEGTPLAQIIPFKRDRWSMKLGSDKEIKDQNEVSLRMETRFFDRYKTMFRSEKEYK
jgi:hypothetical protein